MRIPLVKPFAVIATVLVVLTAAASAWAQNYPTRLIRIVVPTAAGSSLDVLARLLQPYLERSLKQPIVIDNRAGASTMIGTDAVAKAAADGYTLLIVPRTFTLNGALNAALPYDPEKDLAPVTLLVTNPLLFAINAKLPARGLAEFVALAKVDPGKFNYATSGASTQAHLLTEMWSARAEVKMQHIPYRGGTPAALSVAAGETQLALMSPLAIWSHIEAGTVRAVATGGRARDPKLPDLPTAAESGFPGFEAVQWVGLSTTGGTPKAIVQKINTEVNKALQDPDLINKLGAQSTIAAGGTPEEFSALIASEIRSWKETAQRVGLKAK